MFRRSKAHKAALAAAVPKLTVDDRPIGCSNFEYGDTCACGAFYLLRIDGRLVIEESHC